MNPDPKNPSRWRKAILCRTADRPGRHSFKEAILDVCLSRKDEWGKEVEVRLAGAVSDLHAADARYHDDCRKKFMGKRNVESSSKESVEQVDHAFDATVSEMKSDRLRIWSSVEVFSTYTGNDGSLLSRGSLVQRLNKFFADELIVLSSPGLANILLFRSTASNVLRVVDFEEDDKSPEVVAKQIVRECKELCIDKKVYNTRIDKDLAKEETSSTLLTLLSNVSEKLDNNLPALLIIPPANEVWGGI